MYLPVERYRLMTTDYSLNVAPLERRCNHDVYSQLANIEIIGDKLLAQVIQCRRPVGTHRLLHQVMKQLLSERRVSFFTAHQKLRQFARAVHGNGCSRAGLVCAGRIHRLAAVELPKPADGVVMFEREAK